MSRNSEVDQLEYQITRLARFFEATSRHKKYPLERAHYILLRHLQEEALTVVELADRLALNKSTVTRQLNAMCSLGLVKKKANPADGRSTLIEKTDISDGLVTAMQQLRTKLLGTIIADWERDDIAALSCMIDRLLGHFKKHLA